MEKFPKFIIEDGNLIISKVTYHKEIATDIKKVKGGGWYRINLDEKTIIFHGESHDFGKALLEDVKTCVENKLVFSDKYLCRNRNLCDTFTFGYDIGSEIIMF